MLFSKMGRDAERKKAAQKRMRLHTIIAILIPIMDAWEVGLKGGGTVKQMSFKPLELPRKDAVFLKLELPKLEKARDAVVRELGSASFNVGKNFYRTADEKLQAMSEAVVEACPAEASHTDIMRVLTYLVYTALWDFATLTEDERLSVQHLISAFGRIANHLLPADDPLIMPMNKAYYATRDMMQEAPEWYEVDWDKAPQEVWLKAHRDKADAT